MMRKAARLERSGLKAFQRPREQTNFKTHHGIARIISNKPL